MLFLFLEWATEVSKQPPVNSWLKSNTQSGASCVSQGLLLVELQTGLRPRQVSDWCECTWHFPSSPTPLGEEILGQVRSSDLLPLRSKISFLSA